MGETCPHLRGLLQAKRLDSSGAKKALVTRYVAFCSSYRNGLLTYSTSILRDIEGYAESEILDHFQGTSLLSSIVHEDDVIDMTSLPNVAEQNDKVQNGILGLLLT